MLYPLFKLLLEHSPQLWEIFILFISQFIFLLLLYSFFLDPLVQGLDICPFGFILCFSFSFIYFGDPFECLFYVLRDFFLMFISTHNFSSHFNYLSVFLKFLIVFVLALLRVYCLKYLEILIRWWIKFLLFLHLSWLFFIVLHVQWDSWLTLQMWRMGDTRIRGENDLELSVGRRQLIYQQLPNCQNEQEIRGAVSSISQVVQIFLYLLITEESHIICTGYCLPVFSMYTWGEGWEN